MLFSCSADLLDFAEALLLIKERGYLETKVDEPIKNTKCVCAQQVTV